MWVVSDTGDPSDLEVSSEAKLTNEAEDNSNTEVNNEADAGRNAEICSEVEVSRMAQICRERQRSVVPAVEGSGWENSVRWERKKKINLLLSVERA